MLQQAFNPGPPHETWKFSLGPGAVHHRSCASPCRNRRFSACGSSHPAADSASHQSPGGSSQLRKGSRILTAPDSLGKYVQQSHPVNPIPAGPGPNPPLVPSQLRSPDGLRSQCTMPRPWTKARPVQICQM